MPPFEYTNLPSGGALSGSLADLIMRGGQIRAQEQLQAATLTAQSQQQRAALWGKTIENLGQLPFQVQQQNRADQVAASQDQLRQSEIMQNAIQNRGMLQTQNQQAADAARKQAALKAVSDTLPKYQTLDPLTNKVKTDYDGYTQDLTRQGFPDIAEKELSTYASTAESMDKLSKADQARRLTEVHAMGDMAAQSKNGDQWLSGMKMLHDHGLIEPATFANAQKMVEDSGGDWDTLQTSIKGMPGAADAIAARELKDAQAKAALAKAKLDEANALHPKPSGPEMDQQAQALYAQARAAAAGRGPALTPEQSDQLKAYEDRKGTVAAQVAAATQTRQTEAFMQSLNLQRNQFEQQNAIAGRAKIDKALTERDSTQAKMQMVRDTVEAARTNNNQIAGSTEAMMGALGLVTGASGVQRMYPYQYETVKGAGSLLERIRTQAQQLQTGETLSPKLAQDLIAYSHLLEDDAVKKYQSELEGAVSLYGPRSAPGGYAQAPPNTAPPGRAGASAPAAAAAAAAAPAAANAPRVKRFNPVTQKLE